MSQARRLASGLTSQVGSRFIVMALQFVSTGVMARLLEPAEFGVMAAATLVIGLTNAVFDGAFGIGLIQKKSVDGEYVTTTFTMSFLLAVAMFAVLAATSPLTEGFFGFHGLALVLTATATTVIFKSIGSVSRSLLMRQGRFHNLSVASVTTYFVGYCVVSPAMALAGYGVWALVAGAVSAGAAEATANFISARVPLRLAITRASARDVTHTSGLFTVTQVLNWAANSGANAVIGRTLGAEPLGLYSRGSKLLELATSATAQPMQRVLLPTFARMQEDLPRARASFERVLALSIPFFAVLSALLVLHAKAIVLVALGPKWMDTIPVAQILFCALVPRCTYKVSESLAFAFGRSGAAAVRQGLFAAMIIGGSIVGARFGASGVAVAASLSITAFYVVSMGFAARLVGLRGWSLALAHLRAAVLAACVGGADFLVAAFVQARLGFWPGEVAGAAVGGIAVLALFCTIPRAWLGHDLSTLRAQLRARLPRFASGPTQS